MIHEPNNESAIKEKEYIEPIQRCYDLTLSILQIEPLSKLYTSFTTNGIYFEKIVFCKAKTLFYLQNQIVSFDSVTLYIAHIKLKFRLRRS